MESDIIKLDATQICNKCGEKIKKGEYAVKVTNRHIYFCNTACLMRKVK